MSNLNLDNIKLEFRTKLCRIVVILLREIQILCKDGVLLAKIG